MIEYTTSLEGVGPGNLEGFFTDWPNPPSPTRHLELLHGSEHVVLARQSDTGRVVGFLTVVGDGILAAYVPLLEVLPEYREQGIGTQLLRRAFEFLGDRYMIDLVCDEELVPFYERLGMQRVAGMALRNRAALGD